MPDDAYLCDPTPPHGDMYNEHNWSSYLTQTVLVASSAEILDVTSKPVALKKQTFRNNSSLPAVFKVTL